MKKIISVCLALSIIFQNLLFAYAEEKRSAFSLFDEYRISRLALDSDESFDIYPVGTEAVNAGFSALNANATAKVVELDGNKCICLDSIAETAGVLTWSAHERLRGTVILEFDVMAPNNLYYSQIPMIEGYTSDGVKTTAVATYVTSPAKWLMIGMSTIGKINLPLGEWQRFSFEVNTTEKKVSVYLNGKKVASEEAIYNVVDSITDIFFSVKNPGNTLYLDNIKIGTNPMAGVAETADDPRPNTAFPAEMSGFSEQDKTEQRNVGSQLIKNIKKAYESGEKEITIPDGYYRLYNPISLEDYEDFTLNGNDVNIIMEKTGIAVYLNNCKNVTVRGIRVDYDPMSFTQGVVTYVDREKKKFALKIDSGYPEPNSSWAWNRVIPYEPEEDIILSIMHNDRVTELEPLGNKEYFISMSGDSFFDEGVPFREGCRVVIANRKGDGAVKLSGCESCNIENFRVYGSPGFAVTDTDGNGDNHYIDLRITTRPGTNRLLSASADGFHSFNMVKGPTLVNCEISNVEDDIMNLNTSCNYVFDVLDKKTIRVVANRLLCASPDEELKIFDFDNLSVKGEAKVVSATLVNDPRYLALVSSHPSFVESEYGKTLNALSTGTYKIYDLVLDREIDILPYDILTSDSRACAGALIKDCNFHHGFVRGISLRAPDTVIEGCTFDTICNAAIDIEMYSFWLEGPCARNVIIRNNTFNNCVYGAVLDTSLLAVIQTLTPRYEKSGNKEPYDVCHYDNIEISDNIFTGSRACAIALLNASNGKISRNKISNIFNDPYKKEKYLPNYMKLKGFYSAILAEYSENIEIENNEITNIPDWCVPVTNLSK